MECCRTRINYIPAQKQEIWDRWKKGESMEPLKLTENKADKRNPPEIKYFQLLLVSHF